MQTQYRIRNQIFYHILISICYRIRIQIFYRIQIGFRARIWNLYRIRTQICYRKWILYAVLRIRIRWIRKVLASWIRIRKYIRIRGSTDPGKINQKLQKNVTLKTQIWTIEKWSIIKTSWFLNGSLSFSIKITKKIRQ